MTKTIINGPYEPVSEKPAPFQMDTTNVKQ